MWWLFEDEVATKFPLRSLEVVCIPVSGRRRKIVKSNQVNRTRCLKIRTPDTNYDCIARAGKIKLHEVKKNALLQVCLKYTRIKFVNSGDHLITL